MKISLMCSVARRAAGDRGISAIPAAGYGEIDLKLLSIRPGDVVTGVVPQGNLDITFEENGRIYRYAPDYSLQEAEKWRAALQQIADRPPGGFDAIQTARAALIESK